MSPAKRSLLTAVGPRSSELSAGRRGPRRISRLHSGVRGLNCSQVNALLHFRVEDAGNTLRWYRQVIESRALAEAKSALGENGRVVLRYSGTEPLARVMVEAEHESDVQRFGESLADALRASIGA